MDTWTSKDRIRIDGITHSTFAILRETRCGLLLHEIQESDIEETDALIDCMTCLVDRQSLRLNEAEEMGNATATAFLAELARVMK